jgi:hypothetical protein
MLKIMISIFLGFTVFSVYAEIGGYIPNINESMQIEPLDDEASVYVEVESVPPTKKGNGFNTFEIVSSDSEIADQLVLKWGAEIHCQHRIKKLEVDHPSENVSVDNNVPVFNTLVQTLPGQSPFKQGLVGTFNAQSYQIGAIKQACLDKLESGEIDLDPTNVVPDSFVIKPDDYGNGANRIFLRGQCSTLSGNTITEIFDEPGNPNGVPFSPPALEVFCHDSNNSPLQFRTKPNSFKLITN